MGGNNVKENLVFMPARRHFIVHLLLTKIYPTHDGLKYAFMRMFSETKFRKIDSGWARSASKNYEYLKKQISILRSNAMKGNTINVGRKHSEEAKHKMSNHAKGNTKWLGKHHTTESKEKMSNNMKGNSRWLGKHHTKEAKEKVSNARKGKPLSNEHKLKIELFRTGTTLSTEIRNKISISLKGRTFSEEHKKNLSIAAKNRRATALEP